MNRWLPLLSTRQTLLALLAFNLILRILIALALPMTYKEAYFWEWSHFPQLGYLDHPPMVAWLLWGISDWVPAGSVLGLRLPALALGTLSLWLIYHLARTLFESEALAVKALALAASVPVLQAVGILVIPDSPLVLCHLLSLLAFQRVRRQASLANWGLLGLSLGLGLLCKVMMILTVLSFFIFGWVERRRLGHFGPVLMLALSLLIWSPFLYWNASHDWASFQLQLWERHWRDFGFQWWKAGEIVFEQMAAATPLLLPLFLLALSLPTRTLPENWRDPVGLLKLQTALVLGFFFFAGSWITQAHPHWTVLAYPSAVLLLAAFWEGMPHHRVLRFLPRLVLACQVGFTGLALLALLVPQLAVQIAPESLPRQLGNGLVKGRKRLFGLKGLKEQIHARLDAEGMDPDAWLFTDGYQISGPLAFAYEEAPVICLPAYLSTIKDLGHGQAFYLPWEQVQGRGGLYISRSSSASTLERLEQVFERVQALEPLQQTFHGHLIGEYPLYRVEGLRRPSPN